MMSKEFSEKIKSLTSQIFKTETLEQCRQAILTKEDATSLQFEQIAFSEKNLMHKAINLLNITQDLTQKNYLQEIIDILLAKQEEREKLSSLCEVLFDAGIESKNFIDNGYNKKVFYHILGNVLEKNHYYHDNYILKKAAVCKLQPLANSTSTNITTKPKSNSIKGSVYNFFQETTKKSLQLIPTSKKSKSHQEKREAYLGLDNS